MGFGQILNIGRSALYAAQAGLEVTGNNIANVNTPHYSRQRLELTPGTTVNLSGIVRGTGVDVDQVSRIYDRYLGLQSRQAYSEMEDYVLREQTYYRMEQILYPSDESNLNTIMGDFFNALNDLANNPAGAAERQVVLSRAEMVASSFRAMYSSLEDEMNYTNSYSEGYTSEINRLASEIGDVNAEILKNESAGSNANDLRDHRDALLEELAGYLDINVIDEDTDGVKVLVGGTIPIVDGKDSYDLVIAKDTDNHNYYRFYVQDMEITNNISGGKIKGIIETRDQLAQTRDDLDRLAANFINEFNQQHRAGTALDASTNNDFFEPLTVATGTLSTNQGAIAASSATVATPGSMTFDQYQIQFTGAGAFDVVNVTQNTTVASGVAYSDPLTYTFDGIQVSLTGTAVAGDVVTVSAAENMARDIQVALSDTDLIAAAQDTALPGDTLPGDNRNALALADLRDSLVLENGTMSFAGYFNSIVGDVGSMAQDAAKTKEAKETVHQSMEFYRESVSGVSLQEESIRLMAYQQSYQAAAKFMQVTGELLGTLMNMI